MGQNGFQSIRKNWPERARNSPQAKKVGPFFPEMRMGMAHALLNCAGANSIFMPDHF